MTEDDRLRVWSPYLGEMFYSESIGELDDVALGYDDGFTFEWHDDACAWIEGGEVVEGERWKLDTNAVFMPCVGRIDLHDRFMYLGDIVENLSMRRCVVVWHNSPYFVGYDLVAINNTGVLAPVDFMWDEQEIIGNIFENDDMLPMIIDELQKGRWLRDRTARV